LGPKIQTNIPILKVCLKAYSESSFNQDSIFFTMDSHSGISRGPYSVTNGHIKFLITYSESDISPKKTLDFGFGFLGSWLRPKPNSRLLIKIPNRHFELGLVGFGLWVWSQIQTQNRNQFGFGLRIYFYTFWYRNQQMFKIFVTQKFLGPKMSEFFWNFLKKFFLNFRCQNF